MTGIPPHDLPAILAARDDLADLQRRVQERQAFPQSRGMQGLDRVLSRACDGPRRLEQLIGFSDRSRRAADPVRVGAGTQID